MGISKYASKAVFGGQRASVGRVVVAKHSGQMFAGIIEQIFDHIGTGKEKIAICTPVNGDTFDGYEFAEATTEDDVERMPNTGYFWTWPPRV